VRRREFIGLLGGVAAVRPLAARAQQGSKLSIIGFLGASTSSNYGQWVHSFTVRLRELGWIEGHTATIEYRWAEGRSDLAAEIIVEFVRLKVDVIVTHSTPLVVAAKHATPLIPIVFASAGDPVGDGLVASLARPGGNVTGLSLQQNDLASKRLGILRQVVPDLRRLAIMADVDNPAPMQEMDEVKKSARTLGVDVVTLEIRHAEDIAPALEALKDRPDALYVVGTRPPCPMS
jgi:putative tryptophan/tyrosine transport system substrate-binding protein